MSSSNIGGNIIGQAVSASDLDYTYVTTTTGTTASWVSEESEKMDARPYMSGKRMLHGLDHRTCDLSAYGIGVLKFGGEFTKAIDQNGQQYYIEDAGDHWKLYAEINSVARQHLNRDKIDIRWWIPIPKSDRELAEHAESKMVK